MMKVFKVSEGEWVCAETEERAKAYYKEQTGFSDEEINEYYEGEVSLQEKMHVDIDDLPEEEKNNFQCGIPYGNMIYVLKSFEWVIKHERITEPCFIATTE
ncbi:hypothetical protein D0U04_13610 [Bacillus clarus]|uniref:Phage protein n=2 Tax=Bacillus clarus TaxID=2338372 RepID=A0ABX9KVL0_9BACI|nr:hypothetical protein [Bacillus clarus]RFT66481.1 hypothetical protein D0U04_13610 [Bacillus clarus]